MENFFLDKNMNIKLADFGLAKKTDSLLHTRVGTQSYTAPEVYGKTAYSGPPVDVFSMGVILYIMITQYFPFLRACDYHHKNFFKDPVAHISKAKNPVSREVLRLILAMLNPKPEKRPTL